MVQVANCNVCGSKLEIRGDDAGNKIECGHCHSLLRVQDDFSLKILIESIEFEPIAAEQEMEAEATNGSSKIKLKSWKDKVREEGGSSTAASARRTVGGRGRRAVRR